MQPRPERVEAVIRGQPYSLHVPITSAAKLSDHLISVRQSPAGASRRAPEVQGLDPDTTTLAAGREQQRAVSLEE